MAFGLVQHVRFAFEGDDDGDTTRKGGIVHYMAFQVMRVERLKGWKHRCNCSMRLVRLVSVFSLCHQFTRQRSPLQQCRRHSASKPDQHLPE